MIRNRAVFLDRDGTLNEEVSYLSRVEDLKIIPGAETALKELRKAGYLNIVITNQSGISRGFFTEEDLNEIHTELYARLQDGGRSLIDGIYYSPYHPEGKLERYRIDSPDRKPGTGMIIKAAERFDLDLKESFLIGDSLTDMQCAENAGLRKILVLTGYGRRTEEVCAGMGINPDYVAEDILDAAGYITGGFTIKQTGN
ncbi:MAG: HAD family hydrolase [Ignavibacteria bacterium]|nr:HAD family hydrolase [Ignavibacteria bacterium]